MARIALEARSLSLPGGVRTYTLEVIRRLVRDDTRDEFHVFLDSAKFRGTFPGVVEHVVPVGHPSLRLIWDACSLPVALKRVHADLVHYFKPAAAPWQKSLSVVTIHDIIPILFPDAQTRIQRWYWRLQLPLAARSCTHILTVSEASKRDIMNHFQVPPERITVTPLGIGERFRPAQEQEIRRVRSTYRLPQHIVLHVGTIQPRKNLARLLRAFARVSADIPHTLVIAGKWGWRFEDVKSAASDPRIRSRVRFLSTVRGEDLPALYSAADAFAFPSLSEGFGLPPLEAMACGTPVVTSATSSLPEVVGSHALLVHPEDEEALATAMKSIVTDRDLHERLRLEGLSWARRCTWEKTVQQTLAVYQALLAGAPTVPMTVNA